MQHVALMTVIQNVTNGTDDTHKEYRRTIAIPAMSKRDAIAIANVLSSGISSHGSDWRRDFAPGCEFYTRKGKVFLTHSDMEEIALEFMAS